MRVWREAYLQAAALKLLATANGGNAVERQHTCGGARGGARELLPSWGRPISRRGRTGAAASASDERAVAVGRQRMRGQAAEPAPRPC